MTEFLILDPTPADPTDDEMPSMKEPGRILFFFDPSDDRRVDVIDYDGDKAPFWLHEGGFMDYGVRDMVNIELEGFYVLEGVTGFGWKDYFGEYDERWSFEFLRRASESEIKTEALD